MASKLNGASAEAPERSARAPKKGQPGRDAGSVAVDPMSRVLATGPRIPVAVTVAAAVFLHVGVAAGATAAAMFEEIFAWQRGIRDVIAYRLSQYEIEIDKEPPPPEPEPEPEPPPPEPEVKEVKEPPPEAKPVKEDTPQPEPPPQPAQAGKILASDPDPNEPVDLTDSFVQGSADTYAGGQTSSTGTSKKAIYNPAAANTGVPGGTGTAPAPPVVRKEDKSRPPGLLGSVDWNDCPFPAEADAEQIDQAFVMIQVRVRPDGSPESVTVLQDPGHGFGREARKCAMRKKFSPGLDPDGRPVMGTTKPFRVRFER